MRFLVQGLRAVARCMRPLSRRYWCAVCQYPIVDTAFIPDNRARMGLCKRCKRWTPLNSTVY